MDIPAINRRIFVSYARADIHRVRPIYEVLKTYTFELWFDQDDLVPGQRWQTEIARAIRNARVFLLFLSSTWVKNRSYVQKELKLALEILQEMPSDETYIVPVRLDDCSVPDELSHLHWMNLLDDSEISKLASALTKIIHGNTTDFFIRTPIVMGSAVVKRASEAILEMFYNEIVMALVSDKMNQTMLDGREHSAMSVVPFDGFSIITIVHVHPGTPAEIAPTVRGIVSQRVGLLNSGFRKLGDAVMMLDYFIERLRPQDLQPLRMNLFVTFLPLKPESLPSSARVVLVHPEIMTPAEMDQLRPS